MVYADLVSLTRKLECDPNARGIRRKIISQRIVMGSFTHLRKFRATDGAKPFRSGVHFRTAQVKMGQSDLESTMK